MNTIQERNYLNDIHKISRSLERIAKYMELIYGIRKPGEAEKPSIDEMMDDDLK